MGYHAVGVCVHVQCNVRVVLCMCSECCVWISCHSSICPYPSLTLILRCIVLTYARARKR